MLTNCLTFGTCDSTEVPPAESAAAVVQKALQAEALPVIDVFLMQQRGGGATARRPERGAGGSSTGGCTHSVALLRYLCLAARPAACTAEVPGCVATMATTARASAAAVAETLVMSPLFK